ncbi:MAG: cytochrome P450 [Myxococcota bacterium]
MAFSFDPLDEALRRNPFPSYAQARRDHPVFVHEGLNAASVFRYDDVLGMLKDAETYSNRFPDLVDARGADDLPQSMLGQDGPEHTRLRSLVNQAFTPRIVRRLEPRMVEIAEELVDRALETGIVDWVEALTYPLPMMVIAEMIGVPLADRELFRSWSDALIENLGAGLLSPPSPEAVERDRVIVSEMSDYFTTLAAERRATPRDDLLTGLVRAELEGSRLSFPELLQMLILLLVAGNETTTTLIGNATLELLAHPEALAKLRVDPGLLPTAIDEVLRFASPIQADARCVTGPVELHGVRLEADSFVLQWLGSANRDASVFEEPDAFEVARQPNPHLAFGFGPHFCLGSNLARLEARVAIRTLLERTRDFQLASSEPLPLHPSFLMRAYSKIPLELVAA